MSADLDPDLLSKYILTGDWLDAQEYPPVKYAVPGLIPEGFGLLTGPPKIGKSWAVLGIALAVALGGSALGKVPVGDPRPVLYLALEDGERRLQSRARKLLHNEPIPASLNFVTSVPPLLLHHVIGAWMEANGHRNPVIVLDTLGKVMSPAKPGESAYERDYRVGGELKKVSDDYPGSTFLVVHHVRKAAGEDWMDSTSGTNGLNGAADFTINLSRRRNEDTGMIRVTGRDITEGEYQVTVTDGAWTLDGDDLERAALAAEAQRDTRNLGDTAEAVLNYVNAQPAPVVVADVRSGTGIERAAEYLRRLTDQERIRKVGRGTYAALHLGVSSVSSVSIDGVSDDKDTECTQNTPEYTGALDEHGFLLTPNLAA